MNIAFKPLQIDNLKLLHDWFQEPTVKARYAKNQTWSFEDIQRKYLPRILDKDNVPSFIIELDKKAIGFIQYYSLRAHLPEGVEENSALFLQYPRPHCAGLDLFIADESIRGKNNTPSIINAFIKAYCTEFELIMVDPAVTNDQAIYCYTKAGFLRTSYSVDSNHVILIKTRINQSIQLDLLANHPEVVPELTAIWLDVLGKVWLPQISFSDLEKKFKTHLNHSKLPLCLVAFDGNKPIGCVALRATDGIRPEITPWLASLVVDAAYQNRHIGRLLIDAIKQKASYLGFNTIYLLTFDPTLPQYYQRLGFQSMGKDILLNLPVTVMSGLITKTNQ